MTLADRDLARPELSQPPRARRVAAFGFAWDAGALRVIKTGVRLRIDVALVWEILHWAFYLPVLALAAAAARLRRRRASFSLWCTPDRAGPWYLLGGAAAWAGLRRAHGPEDADAAFYFDDSTRGAAPDPAGHRLFNGRCTDISKTRVAEVFEAVFGYPLRVDPATCVGPIVEKADKNGVHDGGVITAPAPARAGYVYQRLVDTTGPDGLVHDLRTPCVGGRPVVVWEKTKPVERRFAIHNSRAVLRDPGDVYSAEELERIAAFTDRMGLDWGGLDILRDRHDGRIYIVDANKTDLGPVIALSWGDKLRSMHRLSLALSELVGAPAIGGRSAPATGPGPARPTASTWTRRVAPLAPLAIVLALGLVWAVAHPQGALISALGRDAGQLRAYAGVHPWLSVLIFVLAYAAAVSLMLPVALILTFAGGYVLGPGGGAVGAMAGATLGAVGSYGAGRLTPRIATERWERRLPALGRLRRAFVSHPFRYTLSMRLMPLTPFTLVSLAAGLNRIGLAPFTLGTVLGVAPECLAYSAIGAGLAHGFTVSDGVLRHPLLWVGLVAAAVLVLASLRAGPKAGSPAATSEDQIAT